MSSLNQEKRRLGQLVVDFANAEDTVEPAHAYFENIQTVMGFSSDFADRAKAVFPSLRSFNSLNKPKRKLLGLYLNAIMPKEEIMRGAHAIGPDILSYNPDAGIFLTSRR